MLIQDETILLKFKRTADAFNSHSESMAALFEL